MLRSDLCDFSDVYIVEKGDITFTKAQNRDLIDVRHRFLAFKNNALFTNWISKINNVLIDNADDFDIVMLKYNLLESAKIIQKQLEVCGIIIKICLIILLVKNIMQIL